MREKFFISQHNSMYIAYTVTIKRNIPHNNSNILIQHRSTYRYDIAIGSLGREWQRQETIMYIHTS